MRLRNLTLNKFKLHGFAILRPSQTEFLGEYLRSTVCDSRVGEQWTADAAVDALVNTCPSPPGIKSGFEVTVGEII
jgi:hypothetical protein